MILLFRLTLLLSCAMHFENYPHDEQICRLSMESRKFYQFIIFVLDLSSDINFDILYVWYLAHSIH